MGIFGLFSGNKKSQTTNQSSQTTNSNVSADGGSLAISATGDGPVNVLDGGAIQKANELSAAALDMGFGFAAQTADRVSELAQSAFNSQADSQARAFQAFAEADRSEGANALNQTQDTLRLLIMVGGGAVGLYALGRVFS